MPVVCESQMVRGRTRWVRTWRNSTPEVVKAPLESTDHRNRHTLDGLGSVDHMLWEAASKGVAQAYPDGGLGRAHRHSKVPHLGIHDHRTVDIGNVVGVGD